MSNIIDRLAIATLQSPPNTVNIRRELQPFREVADKLLGKPLTEITDQESVMFALVVLEIVLVLQQIDPQ